MTVREFYDAIQGSYDEFLGRVGTEERAAKYIRMFKMDPTFNELNDAIAAGDFQTAFRAIHTMKGLSANLALTALHESSVVLTEIFRNYTGQDYAAALADVTEKYNAVISAIDLLN